jgi:putative glycosyltransferase (TIGR04372 family)
MMNFDLYLPRWLKNVQTEKLVSFEDYMSPPTSLFTLPKNFKKAGLDWVKNTPEELEAVTQEMLERTNCDLPSIIDDELQRRFKALAETCGHNYGSRALKAFAPISRDFLERNAYLLEC